MYKYQATVDKIVDGDTVDLTVDQGFHNYRKIRTRLLGINAPEVSTLEGRVARDWLREHLPIGTNVQIQTFREPGDKYGRWLAMIESPALGDVAQAMLSTGHAVVMRT